MERLTYDKLVEIVEELENSDLAPCELSALVEAFEGGDGNGAAIPGAPGTVNTAAAAEALDKFADDLTRYAAAIRKEG